MTRPESFARPRWLRTGRACFPAAALVDGVWWVLRLNSFPDHALWTLFIDGVARYDLDNVPPNWGRPLDDEGPLLDIDLRPQVVGPIEHLVAYGSEVGQPCDNPFCCG